MSTIALLTIFYSRFLQYLQVAYRFIRKNLISFKYNDLMSEILMRNTTPILTVLKNHLQFRN